jgi:hypothetical protein
MTVLLVLATAAIAHMLTDATIHLVRWVRGG